MQPFNESLARILDKGTCADLVTRPEWTTVRELARAFIQNLDALTLDFPDTQIIDINREKRGIVEFIMTIEATANDKGDANKKQE
jgi:hypothetical protein